MYFLKNNFFFFPYLREEKPFIGLQIEGLSMTE